MNILIVEDDPNLRLLWNSVFTSIGHRVETAETAVEARRALTTSKFDLMLLDLYLGVESGLTLATLAGTLNPSCRIVVVTGAADLDSAELYDTSPSVASVLRKPVDIEHLMAVCDHISAS